MKIIFVALVTLLVPGLSHAAEYTFINKHAKFVSQERLSADLVSAGFIIISHSCLDGVTCTVTASDKKMIDPSKSSASFAAITGKNSQRYDQVAALVHKLNLGTATPADKDQLLSVLVYLTFGLE